MNKALKITIVILVFLVVIAATAIATFYHVSNLYLKQLEMSSPAEEKVAEIHAYLDRYFIDEYSEQTLADGAAAGMVAATGDRWSYYLSEDQAQAYMEEMSNAYVGIGVTIIESFEQGGIRIDSVTPASPAERAGILVGDILVEVEGQSTIELGAEGTKNLVRGEAGTSVHLKFLRDGQAYEVDVTRESIKTEVASASMLDDSIGYVKINNFDLRCAEESIAATKQIMQQGAEGIIFDLRFNGGGMKDEMVKILDYLLPEGILFQSVDYDGNEVTDTSDASCIEIPMVVLVNEDSYSAAEFFAAALQEYHWATVVGTKTTGKGNFQMAFELSDGSILNISIGKYFTPQGKSLTDIGITPDVEVDLSDEAYLQLYYGALEQQDDAQLQAAIDVLAQKIS